MQNIDYVSPNEKVKNIQQQLDELLLAEITDKHRKIRAFIKRLNKNHDAILTFLYYPKVPPDNNASERAIRNAKVKMKVSNQTWITPVSLIPEFAILDLPNLCPPAALISEWVWNSGQWRFSITFDESKCDWATIQNKKFVFQAFLYN